MSCASMSTAMRLGLLGKLVIGAVRKVPPRIPAVTPPAAPRPISITAADPTCVLRCATYLDQCVGFVLRPGGSARRNVDEGLDPRCRPGGWCVSGDGGGARRSHGQ